MMQLSSHAAVLTPSVAVVAVPQARYAADEVARQDRHARRTLAIDVARRAFATGAADDAAWICDCLLRDDPTDAEVAILRFDLHIQSRQYEAAYDIIGPFVRPRADTDVLLRAAFAAALTGRPQPEMKKFCDGFLSWIMPCRRSDATVGRSLKALRLSASLAIGADARSSRQEQVALLYLGLALEDDPSNPTAAEMLEGLYSERGDYAQALDSLLRGRARMFGDEAKAADARIRQLRAIVNAQYQSLATPSLRAQIR
jgi:tetratricopeptide (TPR) repeat protein